MARNSATNALAMLMIVVVICSTVIIAELFHDAIPKRHQQFDVSACIKKCNELYLKRSNELLNTCHQNCYYLKKCFASCKMLYGDDMEMFEDCINRCHIRFSVL
ncbi:uncharacterized protein DS421_6g196850 [Arachis hypogaea]|nr:uncharacterized protein DS421_6g196850 [Arachis hypogaea]